MRKISLAAALCALLGVYASAHADIGGPAVLKTDPWLKINGSSDLLPPSSDVNPDSSFDYSSNTTVAGQYSAVWTLNVNPDPFIDGTISITNLSTSAKDFTLNLGLPVSPAFGPSSHFGGSITSNVVDQNVSGSATLQAATAVGSPASIYQGLIDSSPVLQLMAATVNCLGASCNATNSDSDGLPGLTLLGPAVNTSIGTLLKFNLSAGDRVTFNTHFEVVPVPLPAGLPLLASALTFGIGALRRKRFALGQ